MLLLMNRMLAMPVNKGDASGIALMMFLLQGVTRCARASCMDHA